LGSSLGSEPQNIQPSETPEKAKPSNLDGERPKSSDENKRLQQEIQRLRNEVATLRDEGLRLRKLAVSDTVSSTPSPASQMTVGESSSAGLPPIVYLIAAVILGLIIGKFIL
jgi:vesicle-associated membrane protein-associated protein A